MQMAHAVRTRVIVQELINPKARDNNDIIAWGRINSRYVDIGTGQRRKLLALAFQKWISGYMR